ncbi:MAG: enoyl-CoA hydratase-related protein [Rubrivivax sp.]
MRILLLSHAFNGLTQRLFALLAEAGHEVSLELDIGDAVTEEAVALFDPDLVLAPFLKRRIPERVWSRRVCLVVHPGPPGDRGPSSLDWALLEGAREWGVTVLQANGDFDAGAVWAWRSFPVPAGATKSALYRREVTDAAVEAMMEALGRFEPGRAAPASLPALPAARGRERPLVKREQRVVDWQADDTATVLAKARSADGLPGACATLNGVLCRLFDLHEARGSATPGVAVARRGPALRVGTRDGSVWVGHVRRLDRGEAFEALKLPAVLALEAQVLPEEPAPLQRPPGDWDELRYEEAAGVGWLEFDFHNGAMSERQCLRLRDALRQVRGAPPRVLVLAGGAQFFGNGIHLHEIEAAAHREGDSAAEASLRNIEALDDVVLEILTLDRCLTVAALRGNAGAGGCFVALAADLVWSAPGVVLNPHYKNMGNLYGSEYWTYTLPRRVGDAAARELMQRRLPTLAAQAAAMGLVDDCFGSDAASFEIQVRQRAAALAAAPTGPTASPPRPPAAPPTKRRSRWPRTAPPRSNV